MDREKPCLTGQANPGDAGAKLLTRIWTGQNPCFTGQANPGDAGVGHPLLTPGAGKTPKETATAVSAPADYECGKD